SSVQTANKRPSGARRKKGVEGLFLRRPNCTSRLKGKGSESTACPGTAEPSAMIKNQRLVNAPRQTVEHRGFITISPYRAETLRMGPFSPTLFAGPGNYWVCQFGRTYAETAKLASFRIVRLVEKQEEHEFGKWLE